MTIRNKIAAAAVSAAVSFTAYGAVESVAYFSCDFEAGMPQGVRLEDVDGAELHFLMRQAGFDQGDSWKVLSERDGNMYAASPSMHKTAKETPADDRMTLPSILVRGKGACLKWRARSVNEQFDDGGTFTVYINGEKVIDNAATSADGWQDYELPLDSYIGKRVDICFANTTLDGEIMGIDDITVSGDPGIVSFELLPGDFSDNRTDLLVGIRFTGNSDTETVTDVAFSCEYNGETTTASASGWNLGRGDQNTLWASPLPSPGLGNKAAYTVTTTVNGVKYDPVSCETMFAAFRPVKRVVVEEGTGTWCGWCPLGMVATDSLIMRHGDRVIPISIHFNNDPVAYNEYAAALNMGGAPSGLFDRKELCDVPMPLKGTPAHKEWYTIDFGGFGTFAERHISVFPEGEVTAGLLLSEDKKRLDVTTESRFIADKNAADYRLCLVLVEDHVWGRGFKQANYLSGFTNRAPIGGFDELPDPIVSDFSLRHVARKVADNAFRGIEGSIPTEIVAGEEYQFDYTFDIPDGVNVDEVSVVAMIVDAKDGSVVNSCSASLNTTGVSGLPAESSVSIRIENGAVVLTSSEAVGASLYTLSGIRVAAGTIDGSLTLKAHPGIYVLKAGDKHKLITL